MLWKPEQITFYSAPGLGYATCLVSDLMSGRDPDVPPSSPSAPAPCKGAQARGQGGREPGRTRCFSRRRQPGSRKAGWQGSPQSVPGPQLTGRTAPEARTLRLHLRVVVTDSEQLYKSSWNFPVLPWIQKDRNANLCALYMYFEFPVSLYSSRNT